MSSLPLDQLLRLTEQNRLRFPPVLETDFQDFYFESFQWINRIGLFVGLVLWSLFGIIDIFALPFSYTQAYIVRFGVVVPVILIAIVASYRPSYCRWMRLFTLLISLTAGFGVIAMVSLAEPGEVGYYYYIYGLTVVMMFLFTIPGAPFRDVIWASAVLVLASTLVYFFRFDFFQDTFSVTVFVVTTTFLFTLAIIGNIGRYFYELSIRRNFIQRLIIEKEEERSNNLLLNVLPASIAERLKRSEIIADFYPAVSILFVDIVEFTPLSAGLPPAEIVHLLNHIFSVFDDLTEEHTLEKIKTIGDAYMVVSGLPIPRPDHAQVLADLALEMQAAIAAFEFENIQHIKVRIGIHTGPVVGGVIGWRKFAYDLWGDTVNTASRMESHGLPDRIQVTEDYYRLLKDGYRFEPRGEIEVKGKGKMQTYFLLGKL